MISLREELVKVYVSRIEITGFKSFVDRTVIELQPGISAIVGPNGCGKTNICDAIRWVLGEENVRLLRGTRIEDIIFNGSEKRKPTGMAEVSLTLSDVQDTLPLECNEVTITRRVFRSGDSQFYINKVPSRLKDIVNLLLGTGLGRRAYSIMEREMIDWILDDANGQRRRIIEEAAGISKYKVRRQETMNKLALTERDLERVEDLIAEVERRVRSLARQAAKARRYERLVNRIREVETYASVSNYTSMMSRVKEVEGELRDLETAIASYAKDMALAESEIEKKRSRLAEIDREVTARGEEVSRITEQITRLEKERVVAAERKNALADRIGELSKEREEGSALISSTRKLLEQKKAEIKETQELLARLEEERTRLVQELQETTAELKARRERSVVSTRTRLENVQRQIDAASRISEMRSRHDHLVELRKRLETKSKEQKGRLTNLEERIEYEREDLEKLRQERVKIQGQVGDIESKIAELSQKIEEIRREHARLSEEAARASSRYEMLKDLVEKYEGYDHGVRALMSTGKPAGIHGVLGDIIRCSESRYEPAVVTALSEALQYVVVDATAHAANSVRMLKERQEGSATFVILEKVQSGPKQDPVPKLEGQIVGRVADFIDCDPAYKDLVEYLLGDTYVVESLDDAFHLSSTFGDHRLSFVTPDGDAIFRGSIVRSSGDGKFDSNLLGRQDKVRSLETEARALAELAIEQRKAFEELTKTLRYLESQLNDLTRQETKLGEKVSEKERNIQGMAAERDSVRENLDEIATEVASVNREIESLEKDLSESRTDSEQVAIEQGDLFEGIDQATDLEAQVDDLRERLELNTGERLKCQSQMSFLNETVERLDGELATLAQSIENIDSEIERLRLRQVELDKQIVAIEARSQQLLSDVSKADEARKELLDTKNGIEAEIEELRKSIKQHQARREEMFARKQELNSESNLMKVKCDNLRQRMKDEYGIDIAELRIEDLPACDGYESELVELKERLRSLGPVNLIALEEYDVEKERYDFLKEQRDDLIKARQSLDEAIVQINRKARLEFKETFERVQRDFRKNFEILFEGGSADLRLKYENDPLESPIEILAQPSGKRLEQISLLSGGERALTAIAFLFAVYHTKPSPFCLLDEVDAPLDDANVGRFLNLIKDLAKHTQFLVVTHNKKTMEVASCLFGVTMEEPGVSKIVSVRLEKAKSETLEPVG